MHKHWMKVQSLSGAGINFPQEKTINTCIPSYKKIFFQRGKKKEKKRKEQHYSKHKIICMIENRQNQIGLS